MNLRTWKTFGGLGRAAPAVTLGLVKAWFRRVYWLTPVVMGCSYMHPPMPSEDFSKAIEEVLIASSNGTPQDYDERFMLVCGTAVGVLLERNREQIDGKDLLQYIRERLVGAYPRRLGAPPEKPIFRWMRDLLDGGGYKKQNVDWATSRIIPRPPSIEVRNLAPLVILMMPRLDELIGKEALPGADISQEERFRVEEKVIYGILQIATRFLHDEKIRKNIDDKNIDKVLPFLTKSLELAAQQDVWVSRDQDRKLVHYVGPEK